MLNNYAYIYKLKSAVVDRVLEVVDEYQAAISHLERDILLYPVMHSVRACEPPSFPVPFKHSLHSYPPVHILSGDLIMHKRTLQPIHTMISGLRQYDLERSRAVADNVAAERRFMMSGPDDSETDLGDDTQMSDEEDEAETEGSAHVQRGQSQEQIAAERSRRIPPASPASSSSLTPVHHHSSPEAQSPSTSPSATVRGQGKGSDNVYSEDHSGHEDMEPQAGLEEKVMRGKKDKKRHPHQKNARVISDAPPAYDVQAKAQRRRQRKRAWLRVERSRPSPAEHGGTGAHGVLPSDGGASGAYGPSGGVGHPSPPPSYYGTGAQYHDERGYMSPLHRQLRSLNGVDSRLGYSPGSHSRSARMMMSGQRPPKVVGYFSYKAKVYLADVTDHMDFALSSLETFAGITENLIDYAFNVRLLSYLVRFVDC